MTLPSEIEAAIIKVAGDMAIFHNKALLRQQKKPARLDISFKTYYLQIVDIIQEAHKDKE
jgi:hypothetical protein